MDKNLQEFKKLHDIFKTNGFSLYLVGGTVRDYLCQKELLDMDAVTDAKPETLKLFLPDADFTFSRFGSVSYKTSSGLKFDITTMRKEKAYVDSRHPGYIKFVNKLRTDVKRRDFTINALYLDYNLKVIDFVGGQKDLQNRILRMIGKPDKRLKEDPLRIIRALRFVIDYDLVMDKKLDKSIRKNIDLLNKLNPTKIEQDIKKIKNQNQDQIIKVFDNYGIKQYLEVVE